MEVTTFIVILFFSGALAGPVKWQYEDDGYGASVRSQDCASFCTGSSKFRYETGKTYQYQYEISTLTSLHGVSEGVARIDVRATASISVLSKCEMSLSLSDVTITMSEPDQAQMKTVDDASFKSALEDNSLRFSFQDGRIEDLCPSSKEETMSLNFKRGILSAFQNSMNQHERDESVKELDVTGVCPTEYKMVQKGWKSSQFTKVKDLLGCSERHDYRTSLQSTPFHLPDAIQSLPLLKGGHRCNQIISREGFVQSSSCTESLVFRPFSRHEAGARTETTQKLTYTITVGSLKRKDQVTSRSTLLFEHKLSLASSDQTLWVAKQKLTELCRTTVQDIPAEVPGLFADLVYLMRSLKYEELLDIADRVRRGNICQDNNKKAQKFFQDALPMVGTPSSIEMMVNMLLAQEVVGTQADVWITSLHFVHHPVLKMLSHLKKLLSSETHRMSSLLPVTTLLNNFCQSQSNCLALTEVGDIVNILDTILGTNCQSTDQELILMTLRAIGNLGYSDALTSTLEKCFRDMSNPAITRVMAIQAYRGLSCNIDRKSLMNTFLNSDEDSELRIAAYLGVMQCWDETSLNQIRKALEREQVNQVGSFVWTHLTNLMETSSLYKQTLRDILNDENLQKEFNMDRRKYSRNYEVSFFSEKFGMGALAESNLIWSSKTFVPRSAMLNLTIDILGHSVNLLEVGGRVQGLEKLLQNYFGSEGVFKGGEKPKAGPPSRCMKQDKMDAMKKKMSVDRDELSASLYLRMFGNDLGFSHFSENELMSLKNKLSGKDILSYLAKGQDISFTQSAMFMDSSVSVPTVAGMALTLSVNGTTTVELVANGKIDLKKISLKKMEANFEVKPSGAVQLSGMMSLNAGIARAGLKLVTTLHTSTSASGSLDLTNGQVLNLDLDTPIKNMDILDIKSDIYLIYNKAEVKQENTKNKKVAKSSCSPESVLKVLGYELCGAVSFVNATADASSPYFPLTGPIAVSVTLNKKDVPKGFRLVGKLIHNKDTSIAQLSFDTPASLVERAINIGYFLDTQTKTAEIELISPWKKLVAKGSYTIEPKTRKLLANILDDGREHNLLLQLDIDKQKGKTVYIPTLEISRPRDSRILAKAPEKLSLSGSINVEQDFSDISASINIKSGLEPDPIELKGSYVNKEKQNTISGSVTLNKKQVYSATFQVSKQISKGKPWSGKLEPTILISAPDWRPFLLSGSIDYREDRNLIGDIRIRMDRTLKDPINLVVKLTKQKKKGVNRFQCDTNLTSQFATVVTKGTFDVSNDPKKKAPLLTSKLAVDYNIPALPNKALRKDKLTFSAKVQNKRSNNLDKYVVDLVMDSKVYQDASFISNMELSMNKSFTSAMVALKTGPKAKVASDKTHELKLDLSVNHKITPDSADIRYGLKVLYPVQDIEYEIKGKHEHQLKNKFSFETYTTAIFDKGKSVEFRLLGKDNSKKSNLDASGSIEMNFPAFEIDGRKYNSRNYKLGSSIVQNPDKEYIHTINLQMNDDEKHTIVTKFKTQNDSQFDLYSQMQITRDSPITLTLAASRDLENLKGSLELITGGSVYSGAVSSHSTEDKYITNSWDFIWPERRVKGSLEGGQQEGTNSIIKFVTYWDSDKDPTQKLNFEIRHINEMGKKTQKSELAIIINTPFENHKVYTYRKHVELTAREIKEGLQIIWQKMENEFSYSISVLLPPSLERFEMKTKIITPVEKLRKFSFDIIHKFDGSRHLSSNIKGVYNDDEMGVALVIANTGDKVRNALLSSVTFTSTLPDYRNVIVKLNHNDDGRVYSSGLLYERNAEQYKATLETTYFRMHYIVQVDSKLEIVVPSEKPIVIKWVHANSLTNLNSTVSLTWKPGYDGKLAVGGKYNQAEKDYGLDFTLLGPWKEFRSLELQYKHNTMGDVKGSYFMSLNNDPQWTSRATYRYTSSEITLDFSSKNGQGMLSVKFANYPYTALFEQTWQSVNANRWEEQKIVMDASVDKSYSSGWSTNIKLVTPWEEVRNIEAQVNLQNSSQSQWKMDSVISLGVRKQVTLEFTVDANKWSQMNGIITTPYKEMSSFSLGFTRKRTDQAYNSEIFVEMQPIFNKVRMEQSMTLKPDFSTRYYFDLPDTKIKFMELNINHAEQRRGCNTQVKVNYHPDQEIYVNFNGKFNKNKFPENTKVVLDLETPFDALPNFNIQGEFDKEQENGKWAGHLDIKSSSEEFQYLLIKMNHINTQFSCYSDFEVDSSLTETVAIGMHFDWGDMAGANLTLNAPSVGHTMIGFKKKTKSWTDFQNKVFAEFDGSNLDVDIGLKHDENLTKVWLVYAYPGSNHSYIQTSIHRIGNSANDFDVGGFLQVGKYARPYNISMQYAVVTDKLAIGTTLETPFTKSVSYLLKNEKEENGKHVIFVYGKYGKSYLVDSHLSHRLNENRFEMTSRNQYLFDGKGHNGGSTISTSWSQLGEEANVELYCNDNWAKAQLTRKVSAISDIERTENFDLLVFTPYKNFTDVGMHAEVNIQQNRYYGTYSLEYMDEKEAVLSFDMSKPNVDDASVEAILTLPVQNYKKNTFTYHQTYRGGQLTADGAVTTGKGQHLFGKLQYSDRDNNFMLNLTGPVEQFESLIAAGKYNKKQQQIKGNSNLKLSLNSNPITLEYDININNQPATMNFKLRSPYQHLQQADISIQHEGQDWKQFRTNTHLKSESIGEVVSNTAWRFNSLTNMEGKTMLSSAVKNMENLKFEFSTKESGSSQISNVNVGWQADKEIAVKNTWSLIKAAEKTQFSTAIGISTPFSEVRDANLRLLHAHTDQMFSEGMALSHNGQSYLDADLSYQYGGRNEGIVEIRSPRPMSLSVTGSAANGLMDGVVKFNWDKRSPEAHIELVTSLADRSDLTNMDREFKFKAIHPVRIMGVDYLYKKAKNEIRSSGLLTWDEQNGNTFSYDMAWINRTSVYSKMYEGHIKLGVPQRSVKVQSSFSDTGTSLTTSSAVWWDADKDEKKKVTMSTSVETRENLKRVGLNINLPSINKQLNLDGTTKGGYGSSIFDSRAEISYSSDPRKMIVVTSKLSNSEISSPENYNYTMDVGFEHPITDINLQLSSHLGKVGKLSSVGGQLSLLTADKKKMNLAFWGKVDKAKRNLEVKVITPLKTVGIEGHVDSLPNQHHMVLKSFEDDKEALKLDVLMDPRRRHMGIEFNYDEDDPNKIVKFTGHYVNDSAIRVDMISQDGKQSTSESMLAVRLNTSHLLHTRILWRPTLLEELQKFVITKVTAFSYAANEAFTKAVDSVGSEVNARYQLMSVELRSEMSQVFQLMDKEMESLNIQLETLKVEFRRFYQRNDLHIRDMGEQVKNTFNELFGQVQELVNNYRSYSRTITKATNDWLLSLKAYPVAQKYALAVQELVTGLKNLREILEKAIDEAAVEVNKLSAMSYRRYLEITRAIDRKLNSYANSLHELPIYSAMMEQKAHIEKLGVETIPGWTQVYNTLYLKGQQMLQDQYHDMMLRPEFQHLHAVATEVHQQMMPWNMEQGMNSVGQRIIELSKNLMLMELMKLKSYLVDLEKSRVIVFDSERGEIQFEIHLPLPLKSLAETPEIKVDKYLNHMQKWTQVNLPSTNYTLWDTYYEYIPSLELPSLVPPFEVSGYIIGSQHFITFDETHFDFLSTCSHILTRDMANDNFSVVINYEQRSRQFGMKSLCFSIEDSLTFEIFGDYKLEVNSQEMEMPFITNRVKIVREGDFISVNYAGGLEVFCNPKIELYKVTLKGWHHGSVAGLLGKYDNEAVNDKMANMAIQNFEVNSRSCVSKNMALNDVSQGNASSVVCSQIFDESYSKFRPCFKQVDPKPFVRMCDIYLTRKTENEAIHLVTEQYRYVCQGHGVFIGALKEYIPCNVDDPFIVEGKDPIYQSADILFVIEDSICNKWAATSLTSIVTEANNALASAGMKDNRFGLMSYGGIDPEDVSTRTINGKHFGDSSLFLKAVETIRLPNNTGQGDLGRAIRAAINYPYRAGVAKILVVAPCSSCDTDFMSRNLAAQLLSSGVSVHVLQQQGYSYRASNNPRKYKIFGVDNTKIFSNPTVPQGVKVEDVQSNRVSDFCSILAAASNGSLFDTEHLTDNARAQQEFIQAFARRVGWGTKLPDCQTCQCSSESGHIECKLCNSEFIYPHIPFNSPSLHQVIGSLHDLNHDVRTYLGFAK